jgi:hypothetical protein
VSFKVWAPIRRRPTEEQAAEWEAAGRKARRDLDGRPSAQIVGWRLESAFDVSHADGEPIEVAHRFVGAEQLSGRWVSVSAGRRPIWAKPVRARMLD